VNYVISVVVAYQVLKWTDDAPEKMRLRW
jgi:hypothetical protein